MRPGKGGNAVGQPVSGVAGEAKGAAPGVATHSTGQRVLRGPDHMMQGRGQPGLRGTAHTVSPSLVRNHPVGIDRGVGRKDGGGCAAGWGDTAVIL